MMEYKNQYSPAPAYKLAGDLTLEIRNEGEFIIFSEIYMHHEYRDPVLHLLTSLPRDRTVQIVDLGANVGYFTWYAASGMFAHKLPFEITSVEAHPVVYGELMRRIGSHPHLPVKTYCGLIGGETTGKGVLLDNGNHHTLNRLFVPKPNELVVTPHINVQYLDPEVLLPQGTIDLIKVDIEGAEYAFIRRFPAILSRTNRLVMEVHHELMPNEEWMSQLNAAGLKHVHTKQTGLVSTQFWVRSTLEVGHHDTPQPVPTPVPSGGTLNT
jgi:FkbM family methyltransferase